MSINIRRCHSLSTLTVARLTVCLSLLLLLAANTVLAQTSVTTVPPPATMPTGSRPMASHQRLGQSLPHSHSEPHPFRCQLL